MKLHLLNRSSLENQSLTISHNKYKNFLKIWHFHEEFELVLILKSSGTRFVGDSIERFDAKDLVLIGKNVPHMWLNDDEYFKEDCSVESEAIAIHFKREFLGNVFFELPEMKQIANLLDLASRGVKFSLIDNSIIEKLKNIENIDAPLKIVMILSILNDLSKSKFKQTLSSSGFINTYHKSENKRLNQMYEFIFQNFNTPISSSSVANAIGMNKSAFSRFFKKTHRKSFTKYLNDLRVGYACKLLMDNDESITSIAYLSGFNNISNFNRQFKATKGKSPSDFLKTHKNISLK